MRAVAAVPVVAMATVAGADPPPRSLTLREAITYARAHQPSLQVIFLALARARPREPASEDRGHAC